MGFVEIQITLWIHWLNIRASKLLSLEVYYLYLGLYKSSTSFKIELKTLHFCETSWARHFCIKELSSEPTFSGLFDSCALWSLELQDIYIYIYIFFFLNKFIYLFLSAFGLCCGVQAFSSCSELRPLFVVVHGLLIAVSFFVAEHGL